MDEWVVAVLGRGLVDPTEPVVRADDLGLGRGDGCFETCRVVTDERGSSRVDNLDAHLARLTRSLRAMEIDADVTACRELIGLVADAWGRPGEAALRLMVTRGVEGSGEPTAVVTAHAVGAESLRQRRDGIRVVTLPRGTSSVAYQDVPWMLGGVKSLSYAMNMAALREAARLGAEDVIWISSDDTVLEAPTATVVWSLGEHLLTTPDGSSGILAGTTMARLFAGAPAEGLRPDTAVLHHAALPQVDGLWLVSAVRGVAEVVELNGRPRTRRPELTSRLARRAGF